ncbi:MCE family protein, partial [Sulfurovum sp. bin170]|uniref:MlaD family protein n=1 Tax=Sulfurovum sp. bin170 TaxID=2695268 RepID=UPI0013DF25FE
MKKYNAPRVRESRGVRILTTIWLVPFIALIIALWLAYQYYAKIGSNIKISFKSNAGLVENQSPIKMRDVTIGIVKKISLSNDGEGVIIKA